MRSPVWTSRRIAAADSACVASLGISLVASRKQASHSDSELYCGATPGATPRPEVRAEAPGAMWGTADLVRTSGPYNRGHATREAPAARTPPNSPREMPAIVGALVTNPANQFLWVRIHRRCPVTTITMKVRRTLFLIRDVLNGIQGDVIPHGSRPFTPPSGTPLPIQLSCLTNRAAKCESHSCRCDHVRMHLRGGGRGGGRGGVGGGVGGVGGG